MLPGEVESHTLILSASFHSSLFPPKACLVFPALTASALTCVLSCLVLCNPSQPPGLQPARLLCPWDSPGKDTGVHSLFSRHRDGTQVSCIAGRFLTSETPRKPKDAGVGCHALLQRHLPDPGMEPRSPALQADSLPAEPAGKPRWARSIDKSPPS